MSRSVTSAKERGDRGGFGGERRERPSLGGDRGDRPDLWRAPVVRRSASLI